MNKWKLINKRFLIVILAIVFTEISVPTTHHVALAKLNPLVNLGFNQCNGSPCFLGIVPGKTKWQEAKQILLKQGFQEDEEKNLYAILKPDPIQDRITVVQNRYIPDSVDSIEFADPSYKYGTSLIDVLDLYDFPCGVESDYKGSYWFSYPDMLVHAFADTVGSYSSTAVVYILLVDPESPDSVSGISVCKTIQQNAEYLLWFTF